MYIKNWDVETNINGKEYRCRHGWHIYWIRFTNCIINIYIYTCQETVKYKTVSMRQKKVHSLYLALFGAIYDI